MADDLTPARHALGDARTALIKLDKLCCEPGRSPAMAALGETLDRAEAALGHDDDAAISLLEDAGGQVGRLQVGCCAPARLPLYARMLEDFANAQLSINKARGAGH